MITGMNMIPNYRPAPKDLSFGHTLQEVLGTVTDSKNNVPDIIEELDYDIFARNKLKRPVNQKDLDALRKALSENKVVGAAKATVREILKKIKP